MLAKNILKNIAALLAFILMGISYGITVTLYLFETLPLMDQSTVPQNPVAIVILPVFALMFSVIIAAILGAVIFVKRRSVKLSLLLFRKKECKRCIICRVIGYLIILRFVYEGIHDLFEFKQFFINGLWSYASAVTFVLIGMLIFLSIITKDISE